MKKKILSLLVAGVVALGTAMPASATSTQVIQGATGQTETNASVKVNGTVMNQDNIDQSGKIHVEMPTAMAFTVYKDGSFDAPAFKIDNKGNEEINVGVASFQETKVNSGITVVASEGDLTQKDRSHVHLTLRGNTGNSVNLGNLSDDVLATIAEGGSATIQLEGKVGKGSEKTDSNQDVNANGADETFNLVFKISKQN